MLMHRYRLEREGGTIPRRSTGQPLSLSERTINHSIELLSLILEEAIRRPDIALMVNPARDKKLRVKVPKIAVRDWLEPDEVLVLLEAAERIDDPVRPETARKAAEVRRLRDEEKLTIKEIAAKLKMSEGGVCWLNKREPRRAASSRRAIIATLAASGARNTELCVARRGDLDFAHGKIRIPKSKTAKGVREIDMTPWLREQLLASAQGLRSGCQRRRTGLPDPHGRIPRQGQSQSPGHRPGRARGSEASRRARTAAAADEALGTRLSPHVHHADG